MSGQKRGGRVTVAFNFWWKREQKKLLFILFGTPKKRMINLQGGEGTATFPEPRVGHLRPRRGGGSFHQVSRGERKKSRFFFSRIRKGPSLREKGKKGRIWLPGGREWTLSSSFGEVRGGGGSSRHGAGPAHQLMKPLPQAELPTRRDFN